MYKSCKKQNHLSLFLNKHPTSVPSFVWRKTATSLCPFTESPPSEDKQRWSGCPAVFQAQGMIEEVESYGGAEQADQLRLQKWTQLQQLMTCSQSQTPLFLSVIHSQTHPVLPPSLVSLLWWPDPSPLLPSLISLLWWPDPSPLLPSLICLLWWPDLSPLLPSLISLLWWPDPSPLLPSLISLFWWPDPFPVPPPLTSTPCLVHVLWLIYSVSVPSSRLSLPLPPSLPFFLVILPTSRCCCSASGETICSPTECSSVARDRLAAGGSHGQPSFFSQPQFVLELYETLNCGRGGGRMAVRTASSVNQKLKGGATASSVNQKLKGGATVK